MQELFRAAGITPQCLNVAHVATHCGVTPDARAGCEMCGKKAQRKGDRVDGVAFEREEGNVWMGLLEFGPVTLTNCIRFPSRGGPC